MIERERKRERRDEGEESREEEEEKLNKDGIHRIFLHYRIKTGR